MSEWECDLLSFALGGGVLSPTVLCSSAAVLRMPCSWPDAQAASPRRLLVVMVWKRLSGNPFSCCSWHPRAFPKPEVPFKAQDFTGADLPILHFHIPGTRSPGICYPPAGEGGGCTILVFLGVVCIHSFTETSLKHPFCAWLWVKS